MAGQMLGGPSRRGACLSVNMQSDHSMVPPLPDIAPPSAPMTVFGQKFPFYGVFRLTATLDVPQQIALHQHWRHIGGGG